MNGYAMLHRYYDDLFSLVDCFAFNSYLSQEVYSKLINIRYAQVIPITHSGIQDNRVLRTYNSSNLRFGFIGSTTPYKGFPVLEKNLIKLYTAGFQNWTLSVWGGIKGQHIECNKIVFRGKYLSRELYSVFAEIDLLIVPSIWNETFSLITLEALSFGVPVMVSNTVGAKDIVREYDDFFIFKTESELKEKLEIILKDASSLSNYNKKIVNNSWKYSMEIHTEQIRNLYRDILFPQQSINNP